MAKRTMKRVLFIHGGSVSEPALFEESIHLNCAAMVVRLEGNVG